MARSAETESFRVCAQDSFDAYDTPFIGERYPLAQGDLAIVDTSGTGGPHGRALRCGGVGSYLDDAFYWFTGPELPTVYARTNETHRDRESLLVSLWVNIPASAGAFTLIEVWGQDPEDRDLTWTICRLDAGGGNLTFEGGETVSAGAGAVPDGEWCQVQFRVSQYSGDSGEGQALNTAAVRVALPGYEGSTVLGQDEEDAEDGWRTIATKFFDVPSFVSTDGVRVGMLPAGGAGGGGGPDDFILIDDYCVGTVDLRYEAALLYPPGLPCAWQDGLWVEPLRLTGPSEQGELARTDPGGGPPWPAEGAPTSFEAIAEWPAHDGDLTRITTGGDSPGPAAEGFAHQPMLQQLAGADEKAYAVSAPCFGALEVADSAEDPNPRYTFFQTAGADNRLDQAAEEAEHYNPIRPPPHPRYGCGVALQWGPQTENPVLDETGTQEGQAWYYAQDEADATDVFLQAGPGHLVTSLAFEVSHTTEGVLPPYPGPGGRAGRGNFVVWWPEGG
jgi:hypothetical protein